MKNQTLNEQLSRIKSVMGILNESEQSDYQKQIQKTPEQQIATDFRAAALGMGSNLFKMGEALKRITSSAQFTTVNAEVKKQDGKLDIAGIINDECEGDDTKSIKAFIAILGKIGVTASATFTKEGGYYTPFTFKIGTAAATPVAQPQATNGWWDKYPGLSSYMKEMGGKVHYPPAANAQNGAIAIEKDGGKAHDFFPDGRWYQYATVEQGLKAVVKAEYEGKWRERNGVLVIDSTDGETWTSKTKKWVKRMQWTKETGKFPLMYGQVGPTIKTLQIALGLKGDTYFGPTTEKYILAKAPEYKRETGVTDVIYNKIINAAKPATPAQTTTTTQATPPPPTEAELQANPSTLNPY